MDVVTPASTRPAVFMKIAAGIGLFFAIAAAVGLAFLYSGVYDIAATSPPRPSAGCSRSVPPWRSAMVLTMASPSPAPLLPRPLTKHVSDFGLCAVFSEDQITNGEIAPATNA